jgi:hypothetical protein
MREGKTAYCLLPIAYCLLPIAYCLLPIAYCLLPIAYCLSSLVDKITADSVRVTPAMAPIWSSS